MTSVMKLSIHVICYSISLVTVAFCETNVIVNGDFESGVKEPWICNGCTGYVVHPGHNSESSYIIEQRSGTWSGPKQWLDLDSLSPNGRYDFGYSILAASPVELKWKLKACPYRTNNYKLIIVGIEFVGQLAWLKDWSMYLV